MMRKTLALVSLSLGIGLVNTIWSAAAQVVLPVPVPTNPGTQPPVKPTTPPIQPSIPLKRFPLGTNCTPAHGCLGWDEQLWGRVGQAGDRQALLSAIDHSLSYLQRNSAIAAYQN
jgi:membrane-bound lytic murein transglycosylase A